MRTVAKHPASAGSGRRLRALLALAVAVSLVVPVAISWACGPNRAVQLDRLTYSPGQTVGVSGANFDSGASVNIKVDGGTVTSTTVSATGNISASFSAPSSAGTHVVTTDGVDENGQALAGTGNSVTLTIAAPAPSGGGSGSSPGTPPQRQGPTAPPPRTAPSPGTTSGGTDRGRSGGNSRAVSGGERLRRAAARRAPANAGINTTEGVITTRGTTSFAGSVPRATRVEVATQADRRSSKRAAARNSGKAAAIPSESSAGAGLWSGLDASKNPSLMPSATDPGLTGDGLGSGVTLGLALLAAGALALLGLGFAEAQRRRNAPREY